MSNICYEETNFSIYGVILQKAINRVLSKIGVSDKGIKWVIFNEKPYMKNGVLPSSILLNDRNRYGYCNVEEKIIWISTAAIMKAPKYDVLNITQKVLQKPKSDFLVNVILDELAHIKTKKDHGSEVYDDTLSDFYRRYYIENAYPMILSKENMSIMLKKYSANARFTF